MRRRGLPTEGGIHRHDDRDRRLGGRREDMGRRAEGSRENRGDRGYGKDVEKTSPGNAHALAAQYRCGVSAKPPREALGWM